MKQRKLFGTIGVNVLAWIVSLVLLAPLVLILFNSFKTSLEASDMNLALPASLEWENFSTVIEKGKLGQTFLNSLMDEPLSNLDAKLRNQMRAEIIKLRQRINTTFVYVTHDQTEAMTLGDRIVIMRDGFIQQIGTPQEVFNHPSNLFVAGFIGTPQMNFFRDVRLNTENGFYSVEIFGRKFRLEERQQEALKVAGCPSGRVAAGVRPQHIRLKQGGIEGRLEVSEMMGSEQHLHINIGGQEVVAIVPTADIRSGIDKVEIDFLPENIHLFDQATEKNLI